MNTCEKIQFELSLLDQDQTLTGSLERHLKACAQCRHFAAELSQQEFQLRALVYPAARDWVGRMEAAADRVAVLKFAPNHTGSARRERLFGKIALAVALSASLMVGVVGWLTSPFLSGFMSGGPPVVAEGGGNRNPIAETTRSLAKGSTTPSPSDNGSSDVFSSSQTDTGQAGGVPAVSADGAQSSLHLQPGAPSAVSPPSDQGRNELAARPPARSAEDKELMMRNQLNDATFASADPGFLDQLKKAEKPETKVRMVQNLCQQQFESVLTCLKDDDAKKSLNNGTLDNSKGNQTPSSPVVKSRGFDSETPENGVTENDVKGKGRGAPQEDRAENSELGRRLPETPGESNSRYGQMRGDLNQRSQAIDPWDELLRAQEELTTYKIPKLKLALPSPSNDKEFKPLIEELKKQQKELLRLASAHPARAQALNRLAEKVQSALAVLEKPVDGKAK